MSSNSIQAGIEELLGRWEGWERNEIACGESRSLAAGAVHLCIEDLRALFDKSWPRVPEGKSPLPEEVAKA